MLVLAVAHCCAVLAQPGGIACCGSTGAMTYGIGGCETSSQDGVASWADMELCWTAAATHFSNNTRSDQNETISDVYQIFQVILSSVVQNIARPAGRPPLLFDADLFAPGAQPRLGYLPWIIDFAFPVEYDGTCTELQLQDWAFRFSVHDGQPAPYSYRNLKVQWSGCNRTASSLVNFSYSALGLGSPTFSFLTLKDSTDIVSVEFAPLGQDDGVDALNFEECKILDSRLRYFGDVTGDVGGTSGRTQNGTVALRTSFIVQDPHAVMPAHHLRTGNTPYSFGWVGTMNANSADTFSHMADCFVEYISDVQLGTVLVTRTSFSGWVAQNNPILAGLFDQGPSFQVYRADGNLKAYGTLLKDSVVHYYWGVDLRYSSVDNTSFTWQDWSSYSAPVASWLSAEAENPSFSISLESNDSAALRPQTMNRSVACMRPAMTFKGGVDVAPQRLAIDNTKTPGTHFYNLTDKQCASGHLALSEHTLPFILYT